MNLPDEPNAADERTREALAAAHADAKFPKEAADAILARAAQLTARKPSRRWRVPLAMAASFALGILVSRPPWPVDAEKLMLPPQTVSRDGSPARAAVPVEAANPQDWYRYIQELIFTGQLAEAEKHLKRFNELHPDFVPRPE